MNNRRKIAIFWLLFFIGAGGLLLHGCLASNAERTRVRARYEQMHKALCVGDTNAAVLFFAPAYRAGAIGTLGVLSNFTCPLGPNYGISIRGSRADVCPERLYVIPFFNAGHTIKMIKVDDEWYFTGKVSIF